MKIRNIQPAGTRWVTILSSSNWGTLDRLLWNRFALALAGMILLFQNHNASGQEQFSSADLEFFENKIRPILSQRCWECHAGDEAEGDLQLDSRSAIVLGGGSGPAAQPGSPDKSMLIRAINYDGEYEMPPDSKLPPEEIELLTDWVRRGLPWPNESEQARRKPQGDFDLSQRRAAHWCWQPVTSPQPPQVQRSDWVRDPLDRFLLEKLESQGISPADDADRAVWLRRVYLDLTGLLPTEGELRSFLQDSSPNAKAQIVDRLLSSPRFGEHWARHWMDLVRYAETYGHEFDYSIPHAHEYRDYLIRAFNSDLPYDQFVREQIAGDLLPTPRLNPDEKFNESLIGTGFWCFGEATHAPVDVRGDEAIRVENQIDVLSKTFLALTVGCARCHDHKFDAISTQDYYALAGFLKSSALEKGLLDPGEKLKIAASEVDNYRRVVNEHMESGNREWLIGTDPRQFSDAIQFLQNNPAPSDANEIIAWRGKLEEFSRNRELPQADFAVLIDRIVSARDWSHPLFALKRLAELSAQGQELALQTARREFEAWRDRDVQGNQDAIQRNDLLFGLDGACFQTGFAFEATIPKIAQVTDSLELLPGNSLSSRRRGQEFQGVFRSKTFTIEQPQLHFLYRGAGCQIRLVVDGYFMDAYNGLLFAGFKMDLPAQKEFGWVTQAGDIKNYIGHRAHLEWMDHGNGFLDIAEIRVGTGAPPPLPGDAVYKEALGPSVQDFEQFCLTLAAYESTLLKLPIEKWVDSLELVELALQRTWSRHESMTTGTRGVSFQSEGPLGRSDLTNFGEALTKWRQFVRGVPPPKYCIALADCSGENEFVFARGNHKAPGEPILRRNIAALCQENSNLYASIPGSGRLQLAQEFVSPNNPLTSRVAVNRLWHYLFGKGIVASVDNFGVLGEVPSHPELLDYLASEFVRDGWSVKRLLKRICLSRTYGLSSVATVDSLQRDPANKFLHSHPLKRLEGELIRDNILKLAGDLNLTMYGPSIPVHLTEFMQGRGRPGQNGPLDGGGRRSVYQEIRRNFLSPLMLAFDTPAPFSTVGRRNVSNVPAQALIMLNDPFIALQAHKWGEQLAKSPFPPEQRIESMFLSGLSRRPGESELSDCLKFVEEQAKAGSEADAWGALAHVVFNMKEFMFVY